MRIFRRTAESPDEPKQGRESAQEAFKHWLVEFFAPAMRRIGFNGSGQSYTLPDDECWVLLGLQKSRYSTSDCIKFTVNLSAANKLLWSELREWEHYWMAARPSANGVSPGQTLTRLGQVLPEPGDRWWDFGAGATDDALQNLASELVALIVSYGIPELLRLRNGQAPEAVAEQLKAIQRMRPRPAHLK